MRRVLGKSVGTVADPGFYPVSGPAVDNDLVNRVAVAVSPNCDS